MKTLVMDKRGRYHEIHAIIEGYDVDPWWIIHFPWSNACCFNILIQAETMQDALDALADSDEYSHWIEADEEFVRDYPDEVSYLGNDGKPCNLEILEGQMYKVPGHRIFTGFQGSLAFDGSILEGSMDGVKSFAERMKEEVA
jgi:hypothetical protein